MKNCTIIRILVSILLTVIMCFSSIGASAIGDELQGETILHAWCWSFKTIEKNMQEIAAAGYKAVQTSPPQECVINRKCAECGDKGCKHFTKNWYFHYQPTNFTLGNFQLGTKEDFKKMCKEAKKYGVKIIVDIVANHVAVDLNLVSNDIKNIKDAFHGKGELCGNGWNERYSFTQCDLLSLKDLNTHNKEIQNMIMKYMKDCLDCGAWGFRYDAAHHIELPDEIDKGFGSDFWPTVLENAKKNGAKFQYGEVWQDKYSRFSDYAQYMDVTIVNYGNKIRDAICNRCLNHGDIIFYPSYGVGDDKLVTWVESHDNYANEQNQYGASAWMSDDEIRVGWAIVASRKAGVPMFFSRPVDSGGRNRAQFSEKTQIGDKGSDLFKDPYVVAVNKFRKAMKGKSEYLRSQNNKLLIIERGSKDENGNEGMVIINWSGKSEVKSETGLSDGIYVDAVSKKESIVQNGVIYANVENEITILTKKVEVKENSEKVENKENSEKIEAKENSKKTENKENDVRVEAKENSKKAENKENSEKVEAKENSEKVENKENSEKVENKENTQKGEIK